MRAGLGWWYVTLMASSPTDTAGRYGLPAINSFRCWLRFLGCSSLSTTDDAELEEAEEAEDRALGASSTGNTQVPGTWPSCTEVQNSGAMQSLGE